MIRTMYRNRKNEGFINPLDKKIWKRIPVEGLDAEVYVRLNDGSRTKFIPAFFLRNDYITCVVDEWTEDEMTDDDYLEGYEPGDKKTHHIKYIDKFVEVYKEG